MLSLFSSADMRGSRGGGGGGGGATEGLDQP